MYNKVLAAVNEHVNSEVAGRFAKQLAKKAGAKLYLCSIAEPGQAETKIELAQAAAMRLMHAARKMGVEAELLFAAGDPVARIRQIVVTHDIDIVFISTRHEDVQQRFYAGRTTARRLMRHLTCAVAVMRIVHMGRYHPRERALQSKRRRNGGNSLSWVRVSEASLTSFSEETRWNMFFVKRHATSLF
jgi:nucleotide-binding universal stress UspA family protein